MNDDTQMLIEIKTAVAGIYGELGEFKRGTLRRLDTLEAGARSAFRDRSVYVTALITTLVNIITCIIRLMAGRSCL
ncbi:MAG: hypothetical protein LKF96_07145 [Treponema sp.]|jgi:gamma-glutamylcyclotransferase (GGCT)/AIG2-like uncharacterized protein YtfP|nr:hypothetical protein [Treponema sp.]